MKQMSKRILALLCVTVMLFTCCLSGLSFAASAASGGTTEYGNKWTIYYSESGLNMSYRAGQRFEKVFTGFNAQIPSTYELADIALYVHMTLDNAAVAAFEKGGSFEVCQSRYDNSERNWSLTTPEWKLGENIVLLPMSASGSSPGSTGEFDLHQPINYFRVFANPNASEFAAASTVTIHEIALVDTSTAGVTFGADDTHLMLSKPITSTPNSIEASVKVDPAATEWSIGYPNGGRYAGMTNLGAGFVGAGEKAPEGLEYTAVKVAAGAETAMSNQTFSVNIPKMYTTQDIALSFWFYTATGERPTGWFEVTSSGTWDKEELTFNYTRLSDGKTAGWHYVELPLAQNDGVTGTFNLYNVNYIRWVGSGGMKAENELRVSEMKFIVLEKEEEPEEEEEKITEWQLCGGLTSSTGFNTGWSSGSSNSTFGKVWETDASLAQQPTAGTTYVEFTAKGNTAESGVWSPVFTWSGGALPIPEGVALSNLKFSMWMYISDASALKTPNPNFKIGSTASTVDQGLSYSNLLANLKDGWNYIEFPLSAGTQTTNPLLVNDICKFTMRSVNLEWLDSTPDDGVIGTVADQAIVRYADIKISLIDTESATEWSIGVPNGSRYTSTESYVTDANGNSPAPENVNIGRGFVGAGEGAPEGLEYYAVTVNKGAWFAMVHQYPSVEFPEKYTIGDLALEFWIYTSTGEIPDSSIELTSSGTFDNQENCYRIINYIANPQVGWNHVVMPLASPTSKTGEFNYKNANFIRWVGSNPGMSNVAEVRISEMKFIAQVETTAKNEQLIFPTSQLGSVQWSDGSDGLPSGLPYVEKDLSSVGKFDVVMQPSGVNVKVPENTNINDMVFSFWMWVNDVDNISGTGQIELTSSGTCDQQELGYGLNKATLKDGWNHIVIPLNKMSVLNGPVDHTAINFMRWYGLYGANLKVKYSHFSIYVVEDEENPTWSIMNLANAPQNWDGGKMTAGQMWTNDGTGAAQPLDGTVYLEVKPGSGTADIGGVTVWKAGFTASTGNSFIAPNIPSYYNIEDLTFSFWLYVPDVDLLPMVSGAPNFQLTSAGTFDKQALYYSNLLADGIQGEWKDGWNYIELPLSKMGKQAEFDLYNLNYLRWSYFPMYYSESGNDVVRFADFRITTNVDKTPAKAEEVSVTEDDMIIVGNTNTADENPIALFVNKYGNVCWVWGDKQYTTEFNVRTGEWIDLALVRDMTAGLFYLYADGVLVAEMDATGTTDIIPTTAFTIGADGLGVTFVGMIADVRLWSDVRTAEEIVANRVAKKGNKVSPLAAGTEGLIDAWFLVGNLNYVLGGTVTKSVNGNDLVFAGSRSDDWEDYQVPTDVIGEDYYTMVFIPDTQEIVTGAFTEEWMASAQWIADNIENENIVHVIGAGDNTWTDSMGQWNIVKAGWDLFTDKVSWSNMTGNHDYPGSTRNVNDTTYTIRDTTNYNNQFGLDYILSTAAKDTYVGSFADDYDIYGTEVDANGKYSGAENSYFRFNVNGVNWMILQLEYHPRVSVVNWANEILAQYPNDNVILTTHSYINNDTADWCTHWMPYTKSDAQIGGWLGELMDPAQAWPNGDTSPLWNNIVYSNDNVKMVLSGHAGTADGHVLTKLTENAAGNVVPQLMINAQDLDVTYFEGEALAMLAIMRFSADGTKCEVEYYSAYHDAAFHPSNQEMRSLTLNINACAHENTTTNTTPATCVADGLITVTCECGEVISTEVIPATGHINTSATTTPADCENDGATVVTCACGEVISTTVIPALGHTPADAANGKDATCTEDGYTGDTLCSVCGDTITAGIVIPATGHINTTTNTTPADCDTDGLITVTCECGHVVSTTVIPALGHTKTVVNKKDAVINGEAGYTGDVVCDVCDELISEGKDLVVTFVDGYYAENGKPVPYKGMIAYNGNLYYIGNYSRVVTGRYAPVTLNGLLEKGGVHYFDETGALVRTGVYDGYYYKDGKLVPYAGMVEVDGDLYYVVANGAVKTGRYAPVTLNGYAKGNYYFGADGKALRNEVKDGFYYGNDGRCIAYRGLVIANDGNYYYVKDNGAVVKNNAKFYVTTTNGLVNKGFYAFDADGKMILG